MRDFKVGLIVDSLRMDVLSGIQLAASLGVQGLQIHSTGEMDPDQLTQEKRKEVMRAVRDAGMRICAVTGNLGGHSLSRPEEFGIRIPLAKKKIDHGIHL